MSSTVLLAILILSPLVGFLINGLRWKSQKGVLSGTVATLAVFVSFLCTIALFFAVRASGKGITVSFFDWITVGDLNLSFKFVFDQVSALMCLVITGVGTLIHLFSIGYMSHDERPTKYFAYLNLFLFNMLILVLGASLPLMFVGWEGVGLCSYLLIGFWFKDVEKANAGMKAFITNRIGDAGFLIGMFILFFTFGTLDIADLLSRLPTVAEASWLGPMTLAALFLFVGAAGKSAQLPLYVWLPDAMAGPTPVSALIHAATMVTAGVYMIIRLSPLYLLAPHAMTVVAVIGGLTAVFAATMGLMQNDIKKILAYSTVSQLGYMFLGVGVGAFIPAMFHLMTHAFFKALMFLGSGSVIHALHEEQDVRKMGGLAKALPITHLTFFMGWLAIIGIPPFAGFFSKDEILWSAFASSHGSKWLWALGVVGAALTAFYMTRLMSLVFWGKSRVEKDKHPHESPPAMAIPLIVLGVLSVVGGWIGIPHVIGAILPGHPENWLLNFLKPVVPETTIPHASAVVEWSLMGISVGIAGISAWFAYDTYTRHTSRAGVWAQKYPRIYCWVSNKYFVDEGYFRYLINPLVSGSRHLWAYVDVKFIDKMTYFASDLCRSIGSGFASFQNGNFQNYATYIVLGVVITLSLLLAG